MAIFRGTGGQGDSTTDTTVSIVTQKAVEADASATAAAASATQAANSAASINANIVNDTTPQLGGELDGQTNKITNIGDPTSAQDAATKTYVDSQVQSKDALSELSGDSDDITEGSTNLFLTTTERTKLSGIEASATADQTAAEIRTLVESATDSNVFTDADHSKLDGIEASATADQTDAEIKTAYENNSDTNAFTDAEKTKLSGIETGATADQTASEILTAIKTVDGSGSGLDADLLDGNEASAFATSAQGSTADSALQNISEDTTPTLGGQLSTNGNDIVFGNNDQARFGSGGGQGSLVISATATESTIAEAGSGDLTVNADTFKVTNANGLEDMLIATPDAGVALYHNDVKKLETTSSGATITGDLTISGSLLSYGTLGTFTDIIVGGTVDGRDVAADGATLDAVASTYVNVSGDTLTGNLAFGDDIATKFGAGDDLVIKHNGTSSLINNNNGSLLIQQFSNDADVVINSDDGSGGTANYFRADGSTGESILYHYGSEKLATKSTGIDVTGNINQEVSGPSTKAFKINADLGVLADRFLEIYTPATDSASAPFRFNTNNSYVFQTDSAKALEIDAVRDISFYDSTGANKDFYWDASESRLGLGTTSPAQALDVNGSIASDISINAQTGTTYTTVLTDRSKLVTLDNASAVTVTIPPNSSVAYPTGTKIDLLAKGAGQVTVAEGSGVTVNSAQSLKLRAQWSAASAIKLATDTWVLVGDLQAV